MATIFTFSLAVLVALFVIGLLVLFHGIAREANAEQMQHLDRLTPAAQRNVRWQAWAFRHLPVPVAAGLVGTILLAIAMIALDSSTDGRAFWLYFTPSIFVHRVFGFHLPGASLYFWAIVIGVVVLFLRQRRDGTGGSPGRLKVHQAGTPLD